MGFAIADEPDALQVLAGRIALRMFSVVIGKGNLTAGATSKNAQIQSMSLITLRLWRQKWN